MNPMRRIRLTGGADALSLRVVDLDTGDLVTGVVKIELLCTPDRGALVNITQTCYLGCIDVEAVDLGVPLIDLPDDHPQVVGDDKANAALDAVIFAGLGASLDAAVDASERWERVTPSTGPVPDMVRGAFANAKANNDAIIAAALTVPVLVAEDVARLGGPARQLVDALQAASNVQVLPEKLARRRRTKAEMMTARTPAPAPLPDPAPLPEAPSENARRAPAAAVLCAVASAKPTPIDEPDLSDDDKSELAVLLARAAAAKPPAPRATLAPGTPWPFESSEERAARFAKKKGT